MKPLLGLNLVVVNGVVAALPHKDFDLSRLVEWKPRGLDGGLERTSPATLPVLLGDSPELHEPISPSTDTPTSLSCWHDPMTIAAMRLRSARSPRCCLCARTPEPLRPRHRRRAALGPSPRRNPWARRARGPAGRVRRPQPRSRGRLATSPE